MMCKDSTELLNHCISLCDCARQESEPLYKFILPQVSTILLAFLAGYIALLQVKKNILLSARVKWVDDLKDVISKLATAIINAKVFTENEKKYETLLLDQTILPARKEELEKRKQHNYDQYILNMNDYSIYSTKTKLLLSPNDPNQKKVIDVIDQFEQKMNGDELRNCSMEDIGNLVDLLTNTSQVMIETEWNKKFRLFW